MIVEEIQKYVIDRTIELLHKETLDSYRVRHNNVFTSLNETLDIVKRCSEMKVKTFETVKCLANETIDMLNKDTCLRFEHFNKELLILEISDFLKYNADKLPTKIPDVERLSFCLNKCIDENKGLYLRNLLLTLESMLDDSLNWNDNEIVQHLEQLDSVISALCVQLIYEGFSKQFLFLELKYRSEQSYQEFHKSLKELVKKKHHTYEVIWRVYIKEDNPAKLESIGFKSAVNSEHFDEKALKKFAKKIASSKNCYFYQESVDALDRFSAARVSRERVMHLFDCLHLGAYSKKLELPDTAIVLEKRGNSWFAHNCVAGYFLDGSFTEDYSLSSSMLANLELIYKSRAIGSTAKDRIRSAIRYLNYGDLDSEIGQRFINYWIALEFIFSSPHTNENTYTRLKSFLVDVLSVSYVRRNINYLKEKLIEDGIITSEDTIWESVDNLDSIANRDDLPLIWKYKLKVMKSRLYSHTDKLKEYYKNHKRNLERHIARIYNLRNVLVHEGAIKQDVESLASNLRYYLVFLLDQMIVYFAKYATENCKEIQINNFFFEYQNYRRLIDSNFNLQTLLSIPVNKTLW